jgi:hypothetical protein
MSDEPDDADQGPGSAAPDPAPEPPAPPGTVEGFETIGDLLPRKFVRPSETTMRLVDNAVLIKEGSPGGITFQHTILCQTSLPYRNPGDDTRRWQRSQGLAHLEIEAGRAYDSRIDDWTDVGLPFGPKPRLILCYLNAEALRTGSPEIEVDDSLTAFVKRLKLPSDGRSIRVVKDQLTRLSTAELRLAFSLDGQTQQVQAHIVKGFQLWMPKDVNQRVLWPSTVKLSDEYYNNLRDHAVPLDERAVGALSHSAMGLDVYSWLAQRAHRVNHRAPQFITWAALKDQFGWHYKAMYKFKQVLRHTLAQVLTQYPDVRLELDGRGMTLRNSPPPVKSRLVVTDRGLPKIAS